MRQKFEVLVCGAEVVSVATDVILPLEFYYSWQSGSGVQRVPNFTSWMFSSQADFCDIKYWTLLNKDGDPYSAAGDWEVALDL